MALTPCFSRLFEMTQSDLEVDMQNTNTLNVIFQEQGF
jgi:hypothetical protein